MDPPTVEEKIKTAELEDVQLEEVKETKPAAIEEDDALFHCDLFDAEMVQKVADEFLPGLASACIDNTTGGLLNSPASVAVDIRREMVDYLVQRSEMFVAESVVLEGDSVVEVSDNPHDIISDFIDDFAQSKRNFFCKVSSWMLSERREERIDDFVQEMEMNGFWLMARRIAVAQTSIRNIDFKNIYHCSMRFKSEEELSKHITLCGFRELHCENEGCNARFSAAQLELHDSTCPFKILQCEQKCPETLMRREMDRHCITVCPMKLANCPFYPVGCVSTIPQCKTDQHRLENLLPHLTHILKLIHKEASFEALKKRAEHLLEASSPGRLAAARDARSLTVAIKRIDAKLGPLEAEEIKEDNADDADLKNEKKDSTDLSAKKDSSDLSAKKDSSDLSAKKDSSDLSAIKDSTVLSAKKDSSDLSAKKDSTDLSAIKDSTDLSAKKDSSDLSAKKDSTDLSAKKDSTDLSAKKDSSDLSAKKDSTDLSAKKDCSIDLSHNDEQSPQLNSSASPHKTVSPDKSEKVVEPTVTDSTNEHCEKPDSRDLPHYKNDGLKSPDKGEESLSTSEKHQDVTTSAHKLESPKSEDPPKSPEKHHNSTTSEEQKE